MRPVESFRRKRPDEIAKMREAGRILGACLAHLATQVRPGRTGLELDAAAETFIRDHGCVPGFIGYNGYPKSLCVSVNDQVVHGIPSARVIEEGDLVSLDCGLIREGWWADSGLSVCAGEPDAEVRRLLEVTEAALQRGIAAARPGGYIGDIGQAVQSFVEAAGFAVVRQYVGHGIGRNMHEAPQVPNYGRAGSGNQIKPGLVIAIEPMVNAGKAETRVLDDGWTVVTADGRRSCYFEHTVAITESGSEVLTLRTQPAAVAGAAAESRR